MANLKGRGRKPSTSPKMEHKLLRDICQKPRVTTKETGMTSRRLALLQLGQQSNGFFTPTTSMAIAPGRSLCSK